MSAQHHSHPVLADWGELRFLRWVKRLRQAASLEIPFSIGDDAAHLRLAVGRDLLVTTDALIEEVHFRREWTHPGALGAKAMASNLSDLAAMGAKPVAAFLSIGVPPDVRISDLKSFFKGVIAEGKRWNCPLAGGDLVRSPQWVINIMAVGRPFHKGRVIRRSAARPGQTLYVTGQPGESAAGLTALRRGDRQPSLIRRHNRPTPRLREAEILSGFCTDIAMIDVSDGIMNDAGHLARESGMRIVIKADDLPLGVKLRRYGADAGFDQLDAARHDRSDKFGAGGRSAFQADVGLKSRPILLPPSSCPNALSWILFGGEDYELLFTTRRPIEKIREAFNRSNIKTRVTAIGRVEAGRGVAIVDADGKPLRLPDQTFKHFE